MRQRVRDQGSKAKEKQVGEEGGWEGGIEGRRMGSQVAVREGGREK